MKSVSGVILEHFYSDNLSPEFIRQRLKDEGIDIDAMSPMKRRGAIEGFRHGWDRAIQEGVERHVELQLEHERELEAIHEEIRKWFETYASS